MEPSPTPLSRPGVRPRSTTAAPTVASQQSGDEQLALVSQDHLRSLHQPLKYGFADRSTARKGLEVAAGVAIADRLGSIRQTAGPPIGRHGYMAIVWLGSRWLQLEQSSATAIPFSQYRMLHDFGWHESGRNARQALKRTLLNLQEARWEGDVNDSVTGRKTHEDHFGIIDRVLWPVVSEGRTERAGYIFLGSWFLEQLRPRGRCLYRLGRVAGPPAIARKLYGLLENDRFDRSATARSGRPTGWVTPSSRVSARPVRVSATTSRRSRGPVRRLRATLAAAIASPVSGSRWTAASVSSWWCIGRRVRADVRPVAWLAGRSAARGTIHPASGCIWVHTCVHACMTSCIKARVPTSTRAHNHVRALAWRHDAMHYHRSRSEGRGGQDDPRL